MRIYNGYMWKIAQKINQEFPSNSIREEIMTAEVIDHSETSEHFTMKDLKPCIITISEKQMPYSIRDVLWLPCSAKFLALGSDTSTGGRIQIYEIIDGEINSIKEVDVQSSICCGTLGASSLRDRHLATGDLNGNLHVWDLEKSSVPLYSVSAHNRCIQSIDGIAGAAVGFGAPEIATGSHDGYIKIWDPRQKDRPVVIMEPVGGKSRQCWTVAFGNSYNSQERVVCGGFDNGDIKLFDLRSMTVRWEATLDNGICSLQFDSKETRMNNLVATGLDGMITLLKCRSSEDNNFGRITKKIGPVTIWFSRHCPQKTDIFVTGSGKGNLHLWNYSCCNDEINGDSNGTLFKLQETTISSQPITSFSWCPDKFGLGVSASLDQTIRLLYFSKLNQL